VEEVEQQLWALLSPSLLAPRLLERRHGERTWTLVKRRG
jgi:hypothetical protein